MGTVRVRQLKTNDEYELQPDEPALLVPWELPRTVVCEAREDAREVVCYDDAGDRLLARTKPTRLGECHPGERVLIEFDGEYSDRAGWWLCEVEEVGGDSIASS